MPGRNKDRGMGIVALWPPRLDDEEEIWLAALLRSGLSEDLAAGTNGESLRAN